MRCLVGDHLGTWDLVLPRAQFAYNNSVNRSTGLSPHEVVYGHKPRAPIDLIPMSPLKRASESAEAFAYRMSELHQSISDQINKSNSQYKAVADSHRRFKKFDVGDYVMVRMRPERFPQGTFRKLQARGAGPFEIISRVGENGYVHDLPSDWGISPTFSIEDLAAYKGSLVFSSEPFSEPAMVHDHIIPESTPNPFPEPSPSQVCTNNVERIIDDQVTVTR